MKPTFQGTETDGNTERTLPNDCNDCFYFGTNSMSWPGGKCSLHDVGCGLGFTCDSFLDRKEGGAMRQVMLAMKILSEPELYPEHLPVIAEMIIDRGGRRD